MKAGETSVNGRRWQKRVAISTIKSKKNQLNNGPWLHRREKLSRKRKCKISLFLLHVLLRWLVLRMGWVESELIWVKLSWFEKTTFKAKRSWEKNGKDLGTSHASFIIWPTISVATRWKKNALWVHIFRYRGATGILNSANGHIILAKIATNWMDLFKTVMATYRIKVLVLDNIL